MLISEYGFSFLGALPPTQLMGLMGAGWSGNDARQGSDPSMGTPQGDADSRALPAESRTRLQVSTSCPHCGGGDMSAIRSVALGLTCSAWTHPDAACPIPTACTNISLRDGEWP